MKPRPMPLAAGLAALILWLGAGGMLGRAHAEAQNAVLVAKNGTLVTPTNAAAVALLGGRSQPIHYGFGLPDSPPLERWLEEDTPICQTLWEKGGIRYTQKVLVTRLTPGDPDLSADAAEAVLLVQIFGQNTASEYTNAAAIIEVRIDGKPLSLELRGDLVYAVETNRAVLLAVVDVSGSAVVNTNGTRLRFQGNMPPGTSGAMTLKIPAASFNRDDQLNRLRELEFEDEFQRVKKFWKNRTGPPLPPPVNWDRE